MSFATNLGRDAGRKGEGELLQTAQLRVLLTCIFFPFPTGQAGQTPLPGVREGFWTPPW